jgi:hypothetical protein
MVVRHTRQGIVTEKSELFRSRPGTLVFLLENDSPRSR